MQLKNLIINVLHVYSIHSSFVSALIALEKNKIPKEIMIFIQIWSVT